MIGLFLYFSTLFLPRVFRPKQFGFLAYPRPSFARRLSASPPRRLSGLCGGVLDPSPRPGLSHLLWQVVPGYSDSGSSLIGEKIELYSLNEISILE